MNAFHNILEKFRRISFSERDKGDRFERLMKAYLLTDPKYSSRFKNVWLWNDFPARKDFGGKDIGIDLVAQEHNGDYWAIQCKCYSENASIDKPAVDSFLSTSAKSFLNDDFQTVHFSYRMWIATTNKWGVNAEEAVKNQSTPFIRLSVNELENAPVDWVEIEKGLFGENARAKVHKLKPHQKDALTATNKCFQDHDRGKLIMACGTGKTFTSLKIAENETNNQGLVLFLVPSIALLGQTLNEWTAQATKPINAICICSDSGVSRKVSKNEDSESFSVIDLALPASTDTKQIIKQFNNIELLRKKNDSGMTVVFSTYQSIDVIADAQSKLGDKALFDLIICDEAHRTTGVTLAGNEDSAFVKVHNNDFIKAKKRLYMTATPRLYDDNSKSKAAQNDAVLCSMDDYQYYGDEIYRIGFGKAVEEGLLSDYKVLVLTMSENDIPISLQHAIADENKEINTDDASKLIGCISALSKQILGDEGLIKENDPEPMRRAVAFCSNIKNSKAITKVFNETGEQYINEFPQDKKDKFVLLASDHVDGSMSAPVRSEKLAWLKATPDNEKECRILTNARCLSEGVDVPSLDAVIFLSSRNSQVDVVQSVGRVMRTAPNKKYGYIIIPVFVPTNVEADKALDDNERYKVVWTVLNALRAHDDRFNATVNKIELNKKKPNNILVGRPDSGTGDGDTENADNKKQNSDTQLTLHFEELQSAIFARMVLKVGDRRYWEQWAKDVAQIAERYISRINQLIQKEGKHKTAFNKFVKGLHTNINPSISDQDAVDMLAQHLITKPVFEALFEGYSFVQNNAMSKSMQRMVDLLEEQAIEKDTQTLDRFYQSVKKRAEGIDNAEGKQKIIIELYDKFFKTAFPKMVEKLGIVYTPTEVVDFIIHSVDDVLRKEFGRGLTDENVNILDPFTGTGTFITRLLQSGVIKKEDLLRKYKKEIYANEIVLLAYYIASVNIETVFHDAAERPDYIPFDGICLTDTFQLGERGENEHLFSEMFPQNSARVKAQKQVPLRVIIGNPPYSVGQKSANDNAQNQYYPVLDKRVGETYAKESSAKSVKALYDPYIKAFRWASDRLDENGGVICFITNSGWIDKGGADGMRKYFEKEFSSIYIFNLRGAIKGKKGESAKREGQNIFDIMTGVAITLITKNPSSKNRNAEIYHYDIGDYMTKTEKLNVITSHKSIFNQKVLGLMNIIKPNAQGDWISDRSENYQSFIPLACDRKYDLSSKSVFLTYSLGLATGRDSWVYNFSEAKLECNIHKMIDFYNLQSQEYVKQKLKNKDLTVDDFIDVNPTKISWNRNLKSDLEAHKLHIINNNDFSVSQHRPFCKNNIYYNKELTAMMYQNRRLFPTVSHSNLIICVSGLNTRLDKTSVFISNTLVDLNLLDAGTQCFPLYFYEENNNIQKKIFDTELHTNDFIRRDAISEFIIKRARIQYGKKVNKEDIFYYVYGLLHSPEYREAFSADLKKMLPRIPLVEDVKHFWAFTKAGRELAELHLNYENIEAYKGVSVFGEESGFFTVEKMRFPKKDQKDTIIYNSHITLSNIPDIAYEYIINGKSAIEWIMERYQVTVNKDSQIKNDPNDWAEEHNKPRYILDLLLSIINVSVQTMEIVKALPKIKFE